MIRTLYLWYLRTFWVTISRKEAIRLGLTWRKNIYGDNVNFFNARSFWNDEDGNWYRVYDLEL
jgi:hypothetical protein